MKHHELLAQLLIILLASFGIMRAFEWISRSTAELKHASDIFVGLNQYVDIQTTGWLLLLGSLILLTSVFIRGRAAYILMILGSLIFGFIHLFYAGVASQSALLLETVYRANTLGVFGLLVAGIGVWALWQTMKKKK